MRTKKGNAAHPESIIDDLARLKASVESLGEPGFMTTAIPEWKREYLYYLNPNIASKAIDEMIKNPASSLHRTDFESPRAKAFHAGWDYAIQRAKNGVNQICEKLS